MNTTTNQFNRSSHSLTIFNKVQQEGRYNDTFRLGMSFLCFGPMVVSAYGDTIDSIVNKAERSEAVPDKEQIVEGGPF